MKSIEVMAEYRASLEAHIPQTLAEIAKVEQSSVFSHEYKTSQVAFLRAFLGHREQDLIGFDEMVLKICREADGL